MNMQVTVMCTPSPHKEVESALQAAGGRLALTADSASVRMDPTCHAGLGAVYRCSQNRTSFQVRAQAPKGEPCLSVIGYMNWAVYRAFTREEMWYYRTVEDKVSLLVDLYDTANYPRSWYSRRNRFDAKKITPL